MKLTEKKESHTNLLFEVIWFFVKPYKFRALSLLILFLLSGVLEAATIAAIYPILSAAFDAGAGQNNPILSLFGKMAGLLPIGDRFVSYCVFFLLLAVLSFAVKLISVIYRTRLGARVVEKNQNEIYRKLIQADYQYFIDHKQGELIYNVASAPQQLPSLLFGITEFVSQVILSISVLLLLFSLSWQGATAMLVVGAGYQYLSKYLGEKVSYHSGQGEMETLRESNVILNETISGIKQVKAFATGENWIDRFSSIIKRRWHYVTVRGIWGQIPFLLLFLIVYITIGTVVLVIKIVAAPNFMQLIPVFGTFAFALFRLVPFIGSVGSLIMSIMGSLPDCEAIYSIQNNKISHIEDGKRELSSFKTDIRFENVSFSYKNRTETMEEISVTFEKGKTTAIVGRSGSGKTTLINLLLRLFDVDKGEIRIDGINIKEYRLASWLKKIGYVSQDTFILNDTIENNIIFGSDGYSHDSVIKAARYADAHGFISEIPDGYGTFVGDRGMRLSGGQAQRIAVARAMIREPEILIFDEATNNLDNISEAAVQKAIEEIAKDHTVIIIAHRLSTIANADKIVVMENGRVAEEGTHKELIARKGSYWALYQSQPG